MNKQALDLLYVGYGMSFEGFAPSAMDLWRNVIPEGARPSKVVVMNPFGGAGAGAAYSDL